MAGARPDPTFANVVEVISDAASRAHSLNLGATLTAMSWHRTLFFANYTWSASETNTAGAFWLPSTGDQLAGEWGQNAPRHRWSATFNTQPIANLGVSLNVRGQSGSPYNVTTGLDTNGDGVFNDRPNSVGRNSARTASSSDVGTRVSYTIGFGTRPPAPPGGGVNIVMRTAGDTMLGGFNGGADDKRCKVEFYVAAQNLTNHDNYVGYSGVMTSPFFGQPTNVLNPRKVEIGVRFGF